jgi:hypothetical protein
MCNISDEHGSCKRVSVFDAVSEHPRSNFLKKQPRPSKLASVDSDMQRSDCKGSVLRSRGVFTVVSICLVERWFLLRGSYRRVSLRVVSHGTESLAIQVFQFG